MKVINRKWDIIKFDETRIANAIERAAETTWISDFDFIDELTTNIVETINNIYLTIVWIEEIQDIVENKLIEWWYIDVAKKYIIYRNKRAEERKKMKDDTMQSIKENTLEIVKRDWKKEMFDMEKIKDTYKIVSYWLWRECKFKDLKKTIVKYITDDIKTSDIKNIMIKSAIDLISIENPKWTKIAWRLVMIDLYKSACKNRNIDIKDVYTPKNYLSFFKDYVKKWLYSKEFFKHYSEEDILEAWKHLNQDTDFEYDHITLSAYKKRYLLNPNWIIKELPQEMYMSVALFLSIPEKKEDRLKTAIKIYDYCSRWVISLATPLLCNSRTNSNQLFSCFVLNCDDDLRWIFHIIENLAQTSKFWWWNWLYLWNVRSRWWEIRWVKWVSWGVLSWIKIINDTMLAVDQLWSRKWNCSVTLDVWHRDIYDFLDMQTETWDIRWKSFDVLPAVTIPDIFMRRVIADEDWTTFDPYEITKVTWKTLQDYFCEDFDKFYVECENNNKLQLKEKWKARDLFKKFLKTVVETWMPYVFFRDTVNKLNPNNHIWNVYSTQMCTEICSNTAPAKFIEETSEDWKINIEYNSWDMAICNLASINLAKAEFENKEDITNIICRLLDNWLDLNYYPVVETKLYVDRYRPIWVWFMWLSELLWAKKIAYDSEAWIEYTDKIIEEYSYNVYKISNQLSKERWAYKLFDWSRPSKWILLWKDKKWFSENSTLDWGSLLDEIKITWLRFWYNIAPAPNTSTASVVWTTPWLVPVYKKAYTESNSLVNSIRIAPWLNKENFWYYKEYTNIDLNKVIDMIATTQKWVDQSISFEWMINPEETSPKDLYDYYIRAWEKWLKTIYYVRSMSWDADKCISCSW